MILECLISLLTFSNWQMKKGRNLQPGTVKNSLLAPVLPFLTSTGWKFRNYTDKKIAMFGLPGRRLWAARPKACRTADPQLLWKTSPSSSSSPSSARTSGSSTSSEASKCSRPRLTGSSSVAMSPPSSCSRSLFSFCDGPSSGSTCSVRNFSVSSMSSPSFASSLRESFEETEIWWRNFF